MQNMIDWNDIPYFIAVADCGTLAGAANKLSVNHTTVYRRINALEKKLEISLFDRFQDKYSLTDAGLSVMEYAHSAERSIHGFERIVAGEHYRLSGNIVITAPSSSLASDYLAPCISQFNAKQPGINVEVLVRDEVCDLSKGEADIALRVAPSSPSYLVSRKVCDISWHVYASKQYINKYSQPKSMKDLENHKLIGANGAFRHVRAYKCFNEMYPSDNFVCKASDLLTISALCSQGLGVVILPSNYRHHKLVKLFKVVPNIDEQLCILIHPHLLRSARIQVFSDFLYDYLVKQDFHS